MSSPPVLFSPRWWRIVRLVLREWWVMVDPLGAIRLRFYRTACVCLTLLWTGLILRGSTGGRPTDVVLLVGSLAIAVLSAEDERRHLRRKVPYRGNGRHD